MNRGLSDFAKYGSIGIAWVTSTAIYMYLGYKGGTWLDARWGSEPLFMVLGLVLGIALSMQSLIAHVQQATKSLDRDGNNKHDPDSDHENGNHLK